MVEVELPSYLRQSGIAIATSPHTIRYARHHVWAQPLEESISQRLTDAISKGEPNGIDTINVLVKKFHGTEKGDVLIKAYLSVQFCNQETKHYVALDAKQALPGYSATVHEMSMLIDELAQEIAKVLASSRCIPFNKIDNKSTTEP